MILRIKNIEYFEWEVPKEISKLVDKGERTEQDIIDEYFETQSSNTFEISDPYYVFWSRIDNEKEE